MDNSIDDVDLTVLKDHIRVNLQKISGSFRHRGIFGWWLPLLSSTEVSLQNHLMEICFGKNWHHLVKLLPKVPNTNTDINTSKVKGKNSSHQPGCHLHWGEVEEPAAGVEGGGDRPHFHTFTLTLSLSHF